MRLRLLFRPGCVDCLRVKLLAHRIKPDYPDLEIEEIDLTAQPQLVSDHGLGAAPGLVLDGRLISRKHVLEAELRQVLLRRPRRADATL